MMHTMRAVLQSGSGGAETLHLGDTAMPTPAAGELLIKVQAIGVNRADIVQRQGHYPAPAGASPILGLEVAGVVAGWAEGVTGFDFGDAVFGLVAGGAYAEYAVLDAACAIRRPAWLSPEAAASLPEAWMTAWLNLIDIAQLQPGEQVLIHAGASGVGAAATQLAVLTGATVITTVGSDAKARFSQQLGASRAVNYRQESFAEVLKPLGGVDVVLDCIGGGYLADNIASLKTDGRLVVIGLMGGAKAELDLARLLVKRLRLQGSTLRAQPIEVKRRLSQHLAERVLPWLATGEAKVSVDRCFAMSAVAEAHCYLEANLNCGKVMLLDAKTEGSQP